MDKKNINLEVITRQYRKTGAASKGYSTLNTLIQKNAVVGLNLLLRDHKNNPINSAVEILERDNIDYLIDYYSILEIGIIAGYFPDPLPKKIKEEVIYILNNEFINNYFTKHYPLLLPHLLLKQVTKNISGPCMDKRLSVDFSPNFDRFLILRQFIKADSDIEQFLWFLDDGWTEGYSISDFWILLSNDEMISFKSGDYDKRPLNRALWGFVKYIQFLADFADLLRETKDDLLLQSAFWHHQSYWFGHMKERTSDIINIGLNNVRRSMRNLSKNDGNINEIIFPSTIDSISVSQQYSLQLMGVEEDINYLLDNDLGRPLVMYFKEIF